MYGPRETMLNEEVTTAVTCELDMAPGKAAMTQAGRAWGGFSVISL